MKKNKELENVSGKTGFITTKQLADKYQLKALKVSQILREADVQPTGKIPQLDAVSKRPSPGKPSLAYDETAALKAMEQVVSVPTAQVA